MVHRRVRMDTRTDDGSELAQVIHSKISLLIKQPAADPSVSFVAAVPPSFLLRAGGHRLVHIKTLQSARV